MVNLLLDRTSRRCYQPGKPHRHHLRPGLRHRRHALRGREAGSAPRTRAPDLKVFGQDYNDESYAICCSDMLIKGQDSRSIVLGNTLGDRTPWLRRHRGFDYLLANPPFGVDWKAEKDDQATSTRTFFGGRFGAGLPRINDGSLLFLLYMISKMKPPDGAGHKPAPASPSSSTARRCSPAAPAPARATSAAGSSRTTGSRPSSPCPTRCSTTPASSTYIWIVTNRKAPERRGKVQLIDGASFFKKMRKSLGDKRNESLRTDQHRRHHPPLRPVRRRPPGQASSTTPTSATSRITVERPLALRTLTGQGVVKDRESFSKQMKAAFKKADLKVPAALFKAILMALAERDETAEICTDRDGNPEPDPELRDYENVPLKEDIDAYMQREVLPHVPDAWVDESKTKIGYEINFNRYFYQYTPPRPLDEIETDLKRIEGEIADMLAEVAE
jgi:type I restriction enzyme M protein